VSSVVAADLLSEHRRKVADHARALWTLIVLSEWLEWAAGTAQGRSREKPVADLAPPKSGR